MSNRDNKHLPRETTKSFTERKIPRDEQLEIAKKENQRIREIKRSGSYHVLYMGARSSCS